MDLHLSYVSLPKSLSLIQMRKVCRCPVVCPQDAGDTSSSIIHCKKIPTYCFRLQDSDMRIEQAVPTHCYIIHCSSGEKRTKGPYESPFEALEVIFIYGLKGR